MLVDNPFLRFGICLLFGVSSLAFSQTKMDADASDVAALQQKVNFAHTEKIPPLEQQKSDVAKSCRTGKPNSSNQDASAACGLVGESATGDASEQILLKGCSYVGGADPRMNPCEILAEEYREQGRYIEALAALKLPSASWAAPRGVALIRYKTYQSIGNIVQLKSEISHMCYDLDWAAKCIELQSYGEKVDVEDARQRQRDRVADENVKEAQREADDERD